MELFNFDLFANSAPTLRFTLLIAEDVTNWTTVFYVSDPNGNIVFQANGAISVLVANAATLGIFDIILTKTQTAALANPAMRERKLKFSFWRTNPGFEDPLVSGEITVKRV